MALKAAIPECVWCQRSGHVYVTIKVAACTDAHVIVTSANQLDFSGHGSTLCCEPEKAQLEGRCRH